jgi:hypothetical protein
MRARVREGCCQERAWLPPCSPHEFRGGDHPFPSMCSLRRAAIASASGALKLPSLTSLALVGCRNFRSIQFEREEDTCSNKSCIAAVIKRGVTAPALNGAPSMGIKKDDLSAPRVYAQAVVRRTRLGDLVIWRLPGNTRGRLCTDICACFNLNDNVDASAGVR